MSYHNYISKLPKHKVILIPGLGDQVKPLKWAVRNWPDQDLEPIVHAIRWHDGETSFKPKLKILVDMIDSLSRQGDRVSLIGTSAGGSAALNAFIERSGKVHKMINVCGRLRTGPVTGFRSFGTKTISSPAFANSIKLCESREKELSNAERKRIMTVRSLFGDELVPGETTVIQGANNRTVPVPEHMLSIVSALTIFSKPLTSFLKGSS
jgi:pimeloyl-ACP methyl ester carboxylesterase